MKNFIKNFKGNFLTLKWKNAESVGPGSAFTIIGDQNSLTFGLSAKDLAIRDMEAALADFNHNGPYVGGSKSPFKFSNVEKLLYLPAAFKLFAEEIEAVQVYLRNVTICNADRGAPGRIQSESERLAAAIQRHLDSIISK